MNNYIPHPFDLQDIKLPDDLQELTELIAKNVHEVWASQRMSEGWTYGPKRNDLLKTHPCLVAYEDLPEIEKAYDRSTAIETLKLICRLGYKITQ